nr:MAG TPA: hypothetical protein [Caudoviricetes sp.]
MLAILILLLKCLIGAAGLPLGLRCGLIALTVEVYYTPYIVNVCKECIKLCKQW